MPRAIVNITCPWCGGRVDGLESLDVPRTMPCPYCRTELHVPHVGKIVHERVVREVVAPEPTVEDTSTGRMVGGLLGLIFGFFGLLFVALHEPDAATITSTPSHYDQFKACTDACDSSCGPKPDDSWARQPDGYSLDREGMNRSVDWSLCTGKCSLSCSKH